MLTTKQDAKEISWTYGSCNSSVEKYLDNRVYYQTCCNRIASTTPIELKCTDSNNDGWNGAFITINKRKYCEDFLEGNEMVVTIPSKKFLIILIRHEISDFHCGKFFMLLNVTHYKGFTILYAL